MVVRTAWEDIMKRLICTLLMVFLLAGPVWCGVFYVICHTDEKIGAQTCKTCADPVERDEPYISRAENERFCSGAKAKTFLSLSEALAWKAQYCGECK
jgi:hypothetical protein